MTMRFNARLGRRGLLTGIAALAVAASIDLGGARIVSAAAAEEAKLHVSYIGSGTATLPFFMAQEAGYFKEAGLDVTSATYTTGPYAQAVAGEVDILSTEHSAALQAAAGGLPLVFLAETSRMRDGVHQFVVPPDSPIKEPKDLRGKRIGVFNLIGSGRFAIDALLEKGGLTTADVDIVEIALPGLGPALQRGNIDMAHLPGTFLDTARQTQNVRTIADFADLGLEGLPQGAYYATRAAYEADPDKFHRFVAAYMRAVEDGLANPDKLRDYYIKVSKLDPDVVNRLPQPSTPAKSEPQRIQDLADRMFEAGLLDSAMKVGEGNLTFATIYQ